MVCVLCSAGTAKCRAKAYSLWRGKKNSLFALGSKVDVELHYTRYTTQTYKRDAHARTSTHKNERSKSVPADMFDFWSIYASSLWAGKQINYTLKPNTMCHISYHLEANFYKYMDSSIVKQMYCVQTKKTSLLLSSYSWANLSGKEVDHLYFNLPQTVIVINHCQMFRDKQPFSS